jgi:hypothetical protein
MRVSLAGLLEQCAFSFLCAFWLRLENSLHRIKACKADSLRSDYPMRSQKTHTADAFLLLEIL